MGNILEKLKYPIGRFTAKESYTDSEMQSFIDTIKSFPERLIKETKHLLDHDLNKTYRPGGWSIRQVIHHLADSHMTALIRFKLTLTEENLIIKPYNETAFSGLQDYILPISSSLEIINGVHQKWVVLLENMDADNFERSYFHPEYKINFSLKQVLANYDWHCKHHFEHIKLALAAA